LALWGRRKLLDAIAALGADVNANAAPAPAATPVSKAVATATSVPEAAGERRHVTVMFCDLVDSTGIAAKLSVRRSHRLMQS
jgi:class 3 adenylate cyclase